ncbi:MAG: SpoIIE family protein phosphatase [Flammeovirgaceae bacterium]|nr:SpoIIE family protein phosphatase [Flammeovirgaceae bacterium]
MLHAQEGKGLSVLCKIMDTKGHPLANVNVSIDERDLEPSDENGLIIIHQFNPSNKPKKIFAFKEGIELASWGMKKGKIEIIMRESKYKLLFGEVLDLEGDPIVNQEIIFLGKKNAGSSKTDEKGKFKMIFPIETELNENSEFLIEEHSIYHRYFEYKGIYDFKLTIKKNKEGKYLGKFYNGIVLDSSNNPISNVQLNIGGYNYLTNEYGKFKAVLMNSKEGVKAEGYKIVKLDSSTSQNKINLILERDPQYVDLDNTEEKLFSGILDLPTLKRLINDSTNVGEDVKYLLRDLILENIVENIDEEEKINQGLNKVLSKLEGGHDLSKSEKDSVKIQLTRLDKLIQVKKVGFKDYEETLSLIENLKLSILEKEERLSIIKDQKELAQAEFQRKLTIISGITVFLAFLVIVFVVLARKLKKRKNELTLFKSKLELTIGDLEDNNLKITDSIRYAQTIQYAILPQEELMRKYFSDIFIIYRPKDIVSGDFYWFANAQNDSKNDVALIAVVDCTGHGVPGAFMSLIGNTILNEIVDRKLSLDTDEILELLDKEIVSALKQDEKQNDDGMDICLCKLEKVDDNITKVNFTGAKRPLYYIISKDHSLKYLKGDNKMIGGLQKKKRQFTSESFFLQKGDMLYLSTDGYVDQNNKENLKIGKRKFADLLQEVVELPLNEQKRVFEDKLDTHQNGQEQRDDITLIGIKI